MTDAAGGYWDHLHAEESGARIRARETIADALGPDALHDGSIEHLVAMGPVERVVVDASRDASVVVIGTRSTEGWTAKLRGSLTNRLTGQLTCPVVSVPLPAETDGGLEVSTSDLLGTAP